MGNLFDSDQTKELSKLMSEQHKAKLREAIKQRLLEEAKKEQQSLNETVESTPPQEDTSGTGRYVKTMRDLSEKKNDNRQKVIREKNDLLAGDESVTAGQLRQSNQDLWNRVQTSLASLGGGGLGERDVIKLIKEITPPITLDSDDLAAIIPGVLDGLTTDEVAEGNVNLYFTDQRVWQSLHSKDGISDIDSTDGGLFLNIDKLVEEIKKDSDLFDGVNWDSAFAEAFDSFQTLSTTDSLPEGVTNLYYTKARVDSDVADAFEGLLDSDSPIFDSDLFDKLTMNNTDSLPEGDVNLYYTQARVDSDINAALGGDTFDSVIGGIFDSNDSNFNEELWNKLTLNNTDSLPEGDTNLYYTKDRVDSDINGALGGGSLDSALTGIFDSNDPNFNSELWNKLTLNNTDSLPEGSTNLYYTDQRVQDKIDEYVDSTFLVDQIAIDDLTDVTAPTPSTNQYLQYNGAAWVPADVDIDGAILFQGSIDAVTASAPSSPSNGHMYINIGSGTADSSWTGLTTVDSDQQLIWGSDQSSWFSYGGPADAGVVEVREGVAILVADSDAARPTVSVDKTVTDGWYYTKSQVDSSLTELKDSLQLITGGNDSDITALDSDITALNSNKVDRAGDTMTDFLSLHADPTDSMHASTKAYVDARIAQESTDSSAVIDLIQELIDSDDLVHIAGDTMTGFLTLHSDPSDSMHAATKDYVDAQIQSEATDSNKVEEIVNEIFDSNAYVKIAGDSMTGNLSVPDPVNLTDAVNVRYLRT